MVRRGMSVSELGRGQIVGSPGKELLIFSELMPRRLMSNFKRKYECCQRFLFLYAVVKRTNLVLKRAVFYFLDDAEKHH